MILQELYINEEIKCPFYRGLNVILGINYSKVAEIDEQLAEDEQKKVSDTNGIGKTTLVRAISHALGGDTAGAFSSDYFQKNKHWVFLHIEENKTPYVIARPIWRPLSDQLILIFQGTLKEMQSDAEERHINYTSIEDIGHVNRLFSNNVNYKVLIKDEAQSFISRLENIDYSKANIKLSSLLDFIIRDEMQGFGSTVSRALRTEWVQHRSIQYLFGLPAHIEYEAHEHREREALFRQQASAIQEYLKENNIKDINTIQNNEVKINKALASVTERKKDLKVDQSLEGVRKKYQKQRSLLIQANDKLNLYETQLENYKANLENIEEKEIELGKLLDVEHFYSEITDYFPDKIKQNFEEYQKFFSAVSSDRQSYYQELIEQIKEKVKSSKSEKTQLQKELNRLTASLNSNSIVEDISTLVRDEEETRHALKELQTAKKKLQELENANENAEKFKAKRESVIQKGKVLEKKSRDTRIKMIELFHDLVNSIYHTEDGVLDFQYNDESKSSTAGRTEISCSIPSQQSKGRTRAKICIFDYVWFLRLRAKNEFNPQFLIHDGPFSSISPEPKKNMLQYLSQKTLEQEKQYIITANENE